jgi:hypothetical protein
MRSPFECSLLYDCQRLEPAHEYIGLFLQICWGEEDESAHFNCYAKNTRHRDLGFPNSLLRFSTSAGQGNVPFLDSISKWISRTTESAELVAQNWGLTRGPRPGGVRFHFPGDLDTVWPFLYMRSGGGRTRASTRIIWGETSKPHCLTRRSSLYLFSRTTCARRDEHFVEHDVQR